MNKDINAIGIVRQMIADGQVSQEVAEKYFPELAESEDDKIKKDIIQCVKYSGDNFIPFYKSTVGDMISYLEKQGEQKPAWSEKDKRNLYYWLDNNKSIDNDKYRWLKSLKDRVQPQPKQEWSEEDDTFFKAIIRDIENIQYISEDAKKDRINWLKSLKNRYTWRPSEEQMEALLYEVNAWDEDSINGQNLKSLYQDLKKLREE